MLKSSISEANVLSFDFILNLFFELKSYFESSSFSQEYQLLERDMMYLLNLIKCR